MTVIAQMVMAISVFTQKQRRGNHGRHDLHPARPGMQWQHWREQKCDDKHKHKAPHPNPGKGPRIACDFRRQSGMLLARHAGDEWFGSRPERALKKERHESKAGNWWQICHEQQRVRPVQTCTRQSQAKDCTSQTMTRGCNQNADHQAHDGQGDAAIATGRSRQIADGKYWPDYG